MFKLDTAEAVLKTFRPKDRKLVELPDGAGLPMIVRDYVAWTHPAGGRVYLVFAVPHGVPTGIVFSTAGGGPPVPHMCSWCHCGGMTAPVGMLTAAVNRNKRVGVHVCADLSCRQKLEDEADRAGVSVRPAMEKLVERMGRFASEALGIDLTGVGR